MRGQIYEFGPFRLDVRERQLTCRGQAIALRGKVFDTLSVMVEHSGQLMRKDDLMRILWNDSVVEENNLEHNLCILRKILGKNGAGQEFIRTVPRHGYRFVAEVHIMEDREALFSLASPRKDPNLVVEREFQLEQLQMALQKAQSGHRQMIFLTGEAGIGKTTVVRKFLSGLPSGKQMWIGLGECLDQHGANEAYMPVLEALSRLCNQTDGQAVVDVLKRRAPTWLVQIPSAIAPDERLSFRQSLVGLTQERMLREGVEALEAIASKRLFILVLEDLHWSDASTLDLLFRIARGQDPANLLVIGTYRPAEAKNRSASVAPLTQNLRLSESCKEFPLGFLSESGIADYLQSRLEGPMPPELAQILHERTEGNPLFVTTLINFWMENGSLSREDSGCWQRSATPENHGLESPETLNQVIEEQLKRLPLAEREIVEAASIAGVEFCAPVVAAALNCSITEVEIRCAALARNGQFFLTRGRSEWPDGTICQCFRFIHNLYREVTYRLLPAGLRVRWHRQIGERLEQAFASEEDRIVVELAEHLQLGLDAPRSIHYLKKAALQCLERGAAPDAVFHLTGALEMLRRIPEMNERRRLELGIDAILAPALGASKGFGDAETEAAFRRAYDLARQLGEEERQFPIIFGFAVILELQGRYRKAQEFMEKYLPQEELRGGYVLEGLDLLACSRFHQGAFHDALKHAERGAKAFRPDAHSTLSGSLGENPGLDCHAWMALSLWFLGRPDESAEQAENLAFLIRNPGLSYSRSTVWSQLASLHQLRREEKETRLWARRTIRLAAEQGFPYRKAVGNVFHGWALAQQGCVEQGIAEMKDGIEGCRLAGAELDRPYHLALLTESHMLAHNYKKAAATLQEAIEQVEGMKSFFYRAELWRLQGHLQFLMASDLSAAFDCFLRAVEVAQAQRAKSLELRAAVSMGRLLRQRGENKRGADLLASICRSFAKVKNKDNLDLRDALLELQAFGMASGDAM